MALEDRDLRASAGSSPPIPGTAETDLAGIPTLPEDALILIPTRNLVLFPGTVLPITLGRQRSVLAAQTVMRLSRTVGLLLQRDPSIDDPIPVDLHRMGTEASLVRYLTSPDGGHHAICQGERRFRILDFLEGYPFLAARVERIPEVEATTRDIEARLLNLRNQALEECPPEEIPRGGRAPVHRLLVDIQKFGQPTPVRLVLDGETESRCPLYVLADFVGVVLPEVVLAPREITHHVGKPLDDIAG